ncbi:hypothetical protein D3C85_1824850 [compost metagenome]
MQVDAVGAAVDLRSPQAHQFQQGILQATLGQGLLQADHGFVGLGGVLGPFDTVVHGCLQRVLGGDGATVAPHVGLPDSQSRT